MTYYAHMREADDGEIIRQSVQSHITGCAQRAAQCLSAAGLADTGYLAGLLHDMGKYTEEFQSYLSSGDSRKRGSVIHTFQGCRYIMEKFHQSGSEPKMIIASELIAFAIGSHHGLFDCVDSGRRLGLRYRCEKSDVPYKEALSSFSDDIPSDYIDRLFAAAAEETDRIVGRLDETYQSDEDYAFETGLLARLILSAVIEGDRRDTAAFMMGGAPRTMPDDMTSIWEERLAFLEEKLADFPCDTPVAKARHTISETCREFADRAPGIYRLNVPTGGGKTLSSLRYALAHAARYNKRRLIFVSPLLSILEQNARVIREFVGDDSLILEHHSNAVQTDNSRDELDRRELLAESWDSPVIITTLVQFLNTLFDGRTTSVRRFQALCGSVIVLDEVQTVPLKLLTLFNLAIEFLSEQCGATVVLCSATQPEFEGAEHPLRNRPEEIVPQNDEILSAFRRTKLQVLPSRRLDELPELILSTADEADSLLVICNKKSEAAYLLENTQSLGHRSFHLSAAMCMQHRRDVLCELQKALAKGEKVICIATQVVEAGVDISFGSVLRLAAGMDSIVQAAGRCNRSGEANGLRPVYAVNCSDEKLGMLRDIRRGKDATLELTDAFEREPDAFDADLSSDKAIRYYYRALYRSMAKEEQDCYIPNEGTTLFDLMGANKKYADAKCGGIDSFFLRQASRTAGQYFSVFDEDTTDILVPYGKGKELIEELCADRCLRDISYRAKVLKEAGSYTVGIYRYQRERLERRHALIPVCDGCVLVLADGFYDDTLGLTENDENLSFTEV